MARLRRIGDVAQLLLQAHLRSNAAQEDDARTATRLREQAGYESTLRRGDAAAADNYNTQQQLLGRGLIDKQLGARLAGLGTPVAGIDPTLFQNTPDQAMGEAASDIAKITERKALPTDLDIEMSNQGRPGFNAKDPVSIEALMQQRNAKRGQMDVNDALAIDQSGAKSQADALGQAMGTEEAAATNAPAVLARGKATGEQANSLAVAKETQLNPVLANRAGSSAYASSMGQFNATQKQIETDPQLRALADSVLSNPDLLDKVTPTERAKLLKVIAMSPDQEIVNKRQQAAKAIITSGITAFMGMDPSSAGFAGAVGAKGPMSLFGFKDAPFAGSAAGDYAAKEGQLKAALTMPRLDVLRGLGHMSDREFGAIAQSVTALDRNKQSEQDYRDTLSTILPILKTSWVNAGLPMEEFDQMTQGAYGTIPAQGNTDPLASGRSKLQQRLGGAR